MRVLIACEFSGVVREAFRKLGHEAYSCDLLPAEDGSPFHIVGDFRSVNQESWDFVGYHYECRVMANSGVRWLNDARFPNRRTELTNACALFNLTLRDTRPGYSENPVQHCHAKLLIDREQDQTIQPWYFGEPQFKRTCLWLRGIPALQKTRILTPPAKGTPAHKAWSKVHRASPGVNRWKERSRTLPGIAAAMAQQWGKL